MNTMLENYINGNLKDAKKQAKRFSFDAIADELKEWGYTEAKALATAAYLKGIGSLQTACDVA